MTSTRRYVGNQGIVFPAVAWRDNSTNETAVEVEHWLEGQTARQRGSPVGSNRWWSYFGSGWMSQDSPPYHVRVRSMNASGYSAWSNEAVVAYDARTAIIGNGSVQLGLNKEGE